VKSVTADDLVKTYDKGKVRALDGLSLDVEEGTVLSVLGPNGAGKTTVVRILTTLLRADSGSASGAWMLKKAPFSACLDPMAQVKQLLCAF